MMRLEIKGLSNPINMTSTYKATEFTPIYLNTYLSLLTYILRDMSEKWKPFHCPLEGKCSSDIELVTVAPYSGVMLRPSTPARYSGWTCKFARSHVVTQTTSATFVIFIYLTWTYHCSWIFIPSYIYFNVHAGACELPMDVLLRLDSVYRHVTQFE